MTISDFILTPQAANRIAQIIETQSLGDDQFLRITVEGGGCSGFQYKMEMDNTKDSGDIAFTVNNQTVVIDDVSIEYLRGSSLDFEDSLGGSFLKIQNPNATSSCGCGTSFDMK